MAANFHHLLADVPGTGKTVQAIAAASLVNAKRVRIVCPASVRTNWAQEIEECLGHVPAGWQIFSYNAAHELSRDPFQGPCDVFIMDEAHFLKTIDSQRTRAVFRNGDDGVMPGLARFARWIWPLTGTPVLNRPRELYPILKTLHPEFAKMSFAEYAQRYCNAHFDGFGMNTKGASRVDELARLLRGFMTRRTKAEFFPGRTEPIVQLVPIEVNKTDLAEVRAEEDTILDREAYLSPTHAKFGALGDQAKLLRLTGLSKVRATADYLKDLLQTVDKVVVFFHHTEVGGKLAEALRVYDPVIYEGGMSDREKDAVKARFMHNEFTRVFLGQIQAAGTGINGLQSVSSDVVFAEQEWVPGSMGQAIDRLDRMGQKADFVTARILHAPGTLESAVYGSRTGKSYVINRLMGGVNSEKAAFDWGKFASGVSA